MWVSIAPRLAAWRGENAKRTTRMNSSLRFGLWEKKARPPKTGALKSGIDISDSQLPSREDHFYYDPEYPIEAYVS
ncbi:MAG: hypothetical protein JRJ86_17170 [Deltaproteobacteria bacterium]|nr:hypothetical protein [Deltaproteobacteria bacterium]